MKKLIAGLSLAALAAGGIAYAQQDTRDGTITRAEAQARAAEMFTRLDVNKDGKLDAADRTARMAQMFDRLDTDHSGQISREEFAAAHERGPGHEGMGGGAEHEGHEGHPGGKPGRGPMGGGHMGGPREGMMGMARMADANGDGAITQSEMTAAALKHFDSADANKDGKLTPDERRAAQQAMRGKWRAAPGAPAPAATPQPK